MRNKANHRSLESRGLSWISDGDLSRVSGGMQRHPPMGPPNPGATPINFPPLPSLPQRSFAMPAAAAPSPFTMSIASSGGTGQRPIHVINASFNNGTVFANAQVITPAVPAMPGIPLLNGNSIPAQQTHQVNAGFRARF